MSAFLRLYRGGHTVVVDGLDHRQYRSDIDLLTGTYR